MITIKTIAVPKQGSNYYGSSSSGSNSPSNITTVDISGLDLMWKKGEGKNSLIPTYSNNATSNESEVAVGHFNILNEGALFEVGNGTDDENRSNALTVFSNGKSVSPIFNATSNIDTPLALVTKLQSNTIVNAGDVKSNTFTGNSATITTINGTTASISTINSNNITNTGTINTDTIKSNNITNSDTIKTKNLQVTGTAHFFNLIIDKIKSAGGAALFTPADGFDVDIVQDSQNEVKLLWQCQDEDGNQRDNMWKVNDQALCMSFNKAKVGTTHNVSNKYYWALVTEVNPVNEPTVIDGVKYNYITLSKTVVDGVLNPEFGDSIVMCGYRGTDDYARQSAIYISAYSSLDAELTAPLLAQYQGIDDFNLQSHRTSYYDAVGAKFVGDFEVDGKNVIDYIKDKVEEKYSSFSVTIDEINTKVANNTTKITKLGNKLNIANKNITALETTMTNNYSTLNQKADGISAKVSENTTKITKLGENIDATNENITLLQKTVTDNYSTLDQKADSINAKVSSNTTTINNINGQVTTNKTDIANLNIKSDSIESTVSSRSNGTNLFSFTNANFHYFNCMSAIQMNGFFTLGLNQTLFRVMYLGCNGVTGDYVVSFDAMALKEPTLIQCDFCDQAPIENNGYITVTKVFQHYVLHFKNVQATYLRKDLYDGFFDFQPDTPDETNQLYVANFMLERGNIPSSNFTLSDADKNNFKSNNVFTVWNKNTTTDIIDVSDLHNGTTVKAYRQTGLPEGQTYIDILSENNLQNKFKIEPWKVYTLSFWAKTLRGNHRISNYLYPNIANAGLQSILYKDINGAGTQTAYTAPSDGYTQCELDNRWRKFYVHWQPHQIGTKYECICGRLNEDVDANGDKVVIYIAEPKLEEGYICEENTEERKTYSTIKQTANEILAQVNNTYVKIGDGNITLNGDTKVNGSLTLNNDKQGFLLMGNGGTTEISPKSIGTYQSFKDKKLNVIRTHYVSDIRGEFNIGIDRYEFRWSVPQKLGIYKKGDFIKLKNYTNDVYADVSTDLGTPYAQFIIMENGTTTKTFLDVLHTNVDIGNYTVVGDNVEVDVVGQFVVYTPKSIWGTQSRGININIPNTPSINVTVDWDNEVPNKSAFMLIGYDGFGVNFGNNNTVYCGAEGFIANYGDTLLKISSKGIIERKNGANVEVLNGSSSSSSPLRYNLKDGVNTILCKRGYIIITLPREPYQGQSVKIFDKSPQEVWVNFQGYVVGANSDYNSRTYQNKYALDGTVVRTFTFIGDTWFMEYMG